MYLSSTVVLRTVVLARSISMYPVVFNREELQYGTYEMSVWGCWWDDEYELPSRGAVVCCHGGDE